MFNPPTPIPVIVSSYNYGLVALSYVIAAITSYAALNLYSNQKYAEKNSRFLWIVTCGFCLGGGIWSMHFIGMLAFNMRLTVHYDIPMTLFSFTIVIIAASLGFLILSRKYSLATRIISGGTVMGAGIATMHYSGMAAMVMQAKIYYDLTLFATSIFIAISASIVTLRLAINFSEKESEHKTFLQVIASLVMGMAIVGMHYTGMAATIFVPVESSVLKPTALNINLFVLLISTLVILILGIALYTSVNHLYNHHTLREKTHKKALKELARQKDLILRSAGEGIYGLDIDGRVTFVNPAASQLLGYSQEELMGNSMHEIIHHSHSEGTPYPKEKCHVCTVIRDGEESTVSDEVFWRKDGTSFPIEYTTSPILDDGYLKGLVVRFRDITERRENEKKLLEKQDQLNSILNYSTNVIYLKDLNGRYILVNQKYKTMFNLTDDQIIGKTDLDLFPEEAAQAFMENDRKVMELGKTLELEETAPQPDGLHSFISIKSPLYDSKGTIYGMFGISTDITDRKRMEQALREAYENLEHRVEQRTEELRLSNEKYKQEAAERRRAEEKSSRFGRILENSSNEIYVFNAETLKFTQVNRGAQQNLGYTMEELRNLTPVDIKPEFTQEQFEEMVRPLRDDKTPNLVFETVHRRKDGTDYPVEANLQLSKQDTPPQFLAIIQDITERKKAEEAIQESEKQYQLLHNQMKSMLEDTATSTGSDFLNSLVARLASALNTRYAFIGVRKGEDTIKTLSFYPGEGFQEGFEYAMAGTPCEKVVRNQICFFPKNVQSLFPKDELLVQMEVESYLGTPLVDSSKNVIGLVAVLHDKPLPDSENFKEVLRIFASRTETEIERQRIEKELESTYKQLLHSDKLVQAGKLSAQFAHEFNNPLGCVHSVLEQVVEGVSMPEEYRELMEVAVKESERMKGLIEKLVAFHKPSAGIKETFDIHELIDEVLLLKQSKLNGNGVKIEKHYSLDLPPITAIPDQIKQVILNLIQNAQDALPEEGGRITVATDLREDAVEIRIQDTGSGIPPETLENIFEPFVTTKGPNQGTGLGLTVCYGIIQAHGGEIQVQSASGSGSTFTIILPVEAQTQCN